jgi:hypothetical protein
VEESKRPLWSVPHLLLPRAKVNRLIPQQVELDRCRAGKPKVTSQLLLSGAQGVHVCMYTPHPCPPTQGSQSTFWWSQAESQARAKGGAGTSGHREGALDSAACGAPICIPSELSNTMQKQGWTESFMDISTASIGPKCNFWVQMP